MNFQHIVRLNKIWAVWYVNLVRFQKCFNFTDYTTLLRKPSRSTAKFCGGRKLHLKQMAPEYFLILTFLDIPSPSLPFPPPPHALVKIQKVESDGQIIVKGLDTAKYLPYQKSKFSWRLNISSRTPKHR